MRGEHYLGTSRTGNLCPLEHPEVHANDSWAFDQTPASYACVLLGVSMNRMMGHGVGGLAVASSGLNRTVD